MFLPTGSGALYYHAIPITTATTLLQSQAYGQTYGQAYSLQYSRPPLPRPLQRPALLAGRRALRRSIGLFCKLRPEEELRTFLSGKPLIVQGRRFDYEMKKRDNFLQHTMNPYGPHIPYRLHLLAKVTQQVLASGCVIIPETPVIDQLLALILHVQDPDEEMVMIRRTNWSPDISRHLHDLPMAA